MLETIGKDAFFVFKQLKTIVLSEGNQFFVVVDNVLFDKEQKQLIVSYINFIKKF